MRFEIPPHEPAHVVTATSRPLEREVTLLSLSPHMHLRGKAFRYELVTPDGSREVLLDVPQYDFNWQTRYVLREPRKLPAGSVIHCRAVFDNSAENLANPDPEATVRWGDQSWDEMMLGYFDVLLPREGERPAGQKPVTTGLDVVGLFDTADGDQSGGLDRPGSGRPPAAPSGFRPNRHQRRRAVAIGRNSHRRGHAAGVAGVVAVTGSASTAASSGPVGRRLRGCSRGTRPLRAFPARSSCRAARRLPPSDRPA